MDNHAPAARAAIVTDDHWENALQQALYQMNDFHNIDVVILFASSFYAEHFPAMLARVREVTGGALLIGCAGQAICALGRSRPVYRATDAHQLRGGPKSIYDLAHVHVRVAKGANPRIPRRAPDGAPGCRGHVLGSAAEPGRLLVANAQVGD